MFNFFRHQVNPPLIEVSLAEKSAEIVVVDSIRTVFLHLSANSKTDAEVARVEAVYRVFREHLKRRGYHLEIFI